MTVRWVIVGAKGMPPRTSLARSATWKSVGRHTLMTLCHCRATLPEQTFSCDLSHSASAKTTKRPVLSKSLSYVVLQCIANFRRQARSRLLLFVRFLLFNILISCHSDKGNFAVDEPKNNFNFIRKSEVQIELVMWKEGEKCSFWVLEVALLISRVVTKTWLTKESARKSQPTTFFILNGKKQSSLPG